MNTNDGAVLLADNLHDTGSTEDSGLAVTSQVVLSGLNVLSAELLLRGGGGYIRILKIELADEAALIDQLIELVGDKINQRNSSFGCPQGN